MPFTVNHKLFIESHCLFWGHQSLKAIIPSERIDQILDLEFIDWLSSLYWGEGIAMNYAQKMSEISDHKEKWLSVYIDEHRHQTMIGNWFIENNLTPLPKNKLINHLFKQVERMNSSMSEQKIIDTMYATQVFFEELFHALLRERMKFVKDRSLKAIFYQIYQDEADHLGKARTEILSYEKKPKKLYEILEENISKLFPLDVIKPLLDDDEIFKISQIKSTIVNEVISAARLGNSLYSPVDILSTFQKIPGYNCVACSPKRHNGLNLEPKLNSTSDKVEDVYVFQKRSEGFNNVVHGGYIAMVLDEMMGYAPILLKNLLPLTKSMTVNYKAPVMVGRRYIIQSYIESSSEQIYQCKAVIMDENGTTYAESIGTMYVPTVKQGPKILGAMASCDIVHHMLLPS
jgi:acyl-coenzyme A thioesterase PaaI-like protein